MNVTREKIIEKLVSLTDIERVVTDGEVLKESSLDRFRRFEAYHGEYHNPLPAAVVYANSTEEIAKVLTFANEHGINVVPRTGQSATEGGLEVQIEAAVATGLPYRILSACVCVDHRWRLLARRSTFPSGYPFAIVSWGGDGCTCDPGVVTAIKNASTAATVMIARAPRSGRAIGRAGRRTLRV